MTSRPVATFLGLLLLAVSALVVAGVFPFGTTTSAQALVGTAGPITVTVTPATKLTDGQAISIHAQAAPGQGIYSITAHLCSHGTVNNQYAFMFQDGNCPNVPIGSGTYEKLVALPGGSSGDLDGFKVGSGTVQWTDEDGYPHTLTCDATHVCDVVVRVEIVNTRVFFQAPICFGASCPDDTGPVGVPVPAPAPGAATGSGSAATPGSAANVGGTPAPASASGGGSSAGQGVASASGAAAPAAAQSGGSRLTPKAETSSTGTASHDVAATAQEASAVTVPGDGPSRGVRVFIAALAGALGAVRIFSVISKARRGAPVVA
jgi:hypothetical protein